MAIWRIRWHWLIRRMEAFYDSIWFLPTFCALASLVLFLFTSYLDQRDLIGLGNGELQAWGRYFFFAGDAASAQGLLSTIAGMLGTILGVSFSVTLVTIQLTATKYIAQVLPLFERSKVTQLVLGVYLGTVIYSLSVLRTVRTTEPGFVPYVGVNVALVLAVVALFMLILFITEVIHFVRPISFLDNTSHDARYAIEGMNAPEEKPWLDADRRRRRPRQSPEGALPIASKGHGVVTGICWDDLRQVAHNELLRHESGKTWELHLNKRIGDPVEPGEPLAYLVLPAGTGDAPGLVAWVRLAIDVGKLRRNRIDLDNAIESLSGLTVKGTVQGDLDVTFQGIDQLIALVPRLAKEPQPTECLTMRHAGNQLVIFQPETDMLGKVFREITLVSEVALAPSLPFRAVAEGISNRFRAMLLDLLADEAWEAYFRIVHHMAPWYETAFFHMDWVNGMRHLADDLADIAIHARQAGYPGAFEAMLNLMVELHDHSDDDGMARAALHEAFTRLAHEAALPSLSISLIDDIRQAQQRKSEQA